MRQDIVVGNATVRDIKIVRMKELTQILGISRSTIYDKLNPKSRRYDPLFPKPIRLGCIGTTGAVGWINYLIQEWLSNLETNNGGRSDV